MRDRQRFLPQSPNILNVNFIGAVRQKYGLQYCPICLDEDGAFKKDWRLALMPVCLKHNVLLRDRCPHCEQPIYLTKTTSFLKDLRSCTFCWNSLITTPNTLADSELLFYRSINKAVSSGWFSFDDFELYAPLFFKGLWRILYALYGTKGREKKTWERVCEFYDIPYKALEETRIYNSFKDETPEHRHLILKVIRTMISDWPDGMVTLCDHAGITQLVLDLSKSGLPYWLQQIAETELNKNWYKTPIEEFESILKFMERNQIPMTKAGVAKILGQDKSRKLNAKERTLFEDFLK